MGKFFLNIIVLSVLFLCLILGNVLINIDKDKRRDSWVPHSLVKFEKKYTEIL